MKSTIYKTLNLLSIDVSVGAVATGFMVSKFFSVSLPFIWWILLGATVWIIYTLDHLADSKKAQSNQLSERHSFHQKHFQSLSFFVALSIAVVIILAILCLEIHILVLGIILGILSVIYLLYSYQLKTYPLPKELMVSIIYFAGTTFGTFGKCDLRNTASILFLSALFVTVFNNLLLFSLLSEEEDKQAGFDSVVLKWGFQSTKMIFFILIWLSIFLSFSLLMLGRNKWEYSSVLILMNIGLLVIYLRKDQLGKNNAYRIYGDSVFLLPGLSFILIFR